MVVSIAAGGHRQRVIQRRNQLVEEHLDLVRVIARTVAQSLPPSFDIDDLIQAGNVALIHAAARYRPDLHGDTPFRAYARQAVRGAIIESIRRRRYTESTRPSLDAAPEPTATPDHVVAIDEWKKRKQVAKAVERLPEEERAVVEEYYSSTEPSLDKVAKVLEMPRVRTLRLHQQAIGRLRAALAG